MANDLIVQQGIVIVSVANFFKRLTQVEDEKAAIVVRGKKPRNLKEKDDPAPGKRPRMRQNPKP
jgi:hypothetical protein